MHLVMLMDDAHINEVTRAILGAAIEVHKTLGPGYLESVYHPCLEYELSQRQLRFVKQLEVPIAYKSLHLAARYRVDLIVEDLVVVEIKSVDALAPIHQSQVLTYLRLAERPIGLLINFNSVKLMDGVKRLINPRVSRTRS